MRWDGLFTSTKLVLTMELLVPILGKDWSDKKVQYAPVGVRIDIAISHFCAFEFRLRTRYNKLYGRRHEEVLSLFAHSLLLLVLFFLGVIKLRLRDMTFLLHPMNSDTHWWCNWKAVHQSLS